MKPCLYFGTARAWACVALLGSLASACGPELDVGSDVLWATDNERGDLTDWYAPASPRNISGSNPPGGGLLSDAPTSPVEIVAGPAHSGRYSLKLTDLAESDINGPGVYRELIAPPDAYYSAWYYIPRLYQTNSQWTIMKFRARSDENPDLISHGHDLNLRTLPGGVHVVLYVYSHDPMYLQAPLADPPPIVPVETWFQLEVLDRPRTDETGELKVWLNDRLVYDLENRRTSDFDDVLWTPCNVGEDVQPLGAASDSLGDGGAGGVGGDAGAASAAGGSSARVPPELYIDDAAISLKRVTRAGKILVAR